MGDAAPLRRYDVARDSCNPRDRSPTSYSWRSQSPPRWSSPSAQSSRYSPRESRDRSRSPRRWRSPSRFRNRSQSPPLRGDFSPRRRRSPSPQSHFSRNESKTIHHSNMLAEKAMSMATFRRIVADPNSPWSKSAKKSVKMPIPIPLNEGESVADYMRKFEFWLAQRNLTLASLRKGNPGVERSYRYSYAYWRLVRVDEQSSPRTGEAHNSNLHAPTWHRERSASRTRRSEPYAPPHRLNRDYMEHDVRTNVSSESPQSNRIPLQSTSEYRDGRYSSRSNSEKCREADTCCETCGRKWSDLTTRLKKLEGIVARLELPSPKSSTGLRGSYVDSRDESSSQAHSSELIDLTDDMEPVTEGTSIRNTGTPKRTQVDEVRDKPAEISPSIEGDDTHEQSMIASDPNSVYNRAANNPETEETCSLASLIAGYNQLNDQVLLNEKVEEDALARMESTIGEDQAVAVELRSQIYELRSSIKVEQDKRDVAVTAIIAFIYAEKKDVLPGEINALAASGVVNDDQSLHEECANIASTIAEKNNKLARLQSELAAHKDNNTVEAEQLSSEIELECTSKAQLETDRHKIFLRLMKSNRHIQALVKTKLGHA